MKVDRLDTLYQDADENNIIIMACPIREESTIINDCGEVAIVLTTSGSFSRTYLLYLMAHEMAHYHTGTYYRRYSPLQLKERAEYKADTWMVCDLVPIDDLHEAILDGYTEVWELAEYFDVPEKVILRADEIYHAKGLL